MYTNAESHTRSSEIELTGDTSYLSTNQLLSNSHLQALPTELTQLILTYLPLTDVLAVSLTSLLPMFLLSH